MFTKVTLCGKRCPPRSKQMVDNNEEKCCLQRQENLREKENHLFAFYPFLSGRSLFPFHCVVAPPPPPRSSEVTSPILPSQSQLIQPTGGRIFQLSSAQQGKSWKRPHYSTLSMSVGWWPGCWANKFGQFGIIIMTSWCVPESELIQPSVNVKRSLISKQIMVKIWPLHHVPVLFLVGPT